MQPIVDLMGAKDLAFLFTPAENAVNPEALVACFRFPKGEDVYASRQRRGVRGQERLGRLQDAQSKKTIMRTINTQLQTMKGNQFLPHPFRGSHSFVFVNLLSSLMSLG